MKMNILTHAQTTSANFPKTSETTPKELISPVEVLNDRKLSTMTNVAQKESIKTDSSTALKSTCSITDVKEVQNSDTKNKLSLTKLPSSASASAFTPVYKQNPGASNNASKNFW